MVLLMTDNVINFPSHKSTDPITDVAREMIKVSIKEAGKYGYNLTKHPEALLDFEIIYKMLVSTLARSRGIDHPMQPIMDDLTGINQDID